MGLVGSSHIFTSTEIDYVDIQYALVKVVRYKLSRLHKPYNKGSQYHQLSSKNTA